eukprot:GDKI01037419.1.p1 GENE.GDKI01037419.1~~GDKI01037419.1.p1  ORF type:complete len:586 (-),score=268.32 GDKI01037419.1:357-2114(-)
MCVYVHGDLAKRGLPLFRTTNSLNPVFIPRRFPLYIPVSTIMSAPSESVPKAPEVVENAPTADGADGKKEKVDRKALKEARAAERQQKQAAAKQEASGPADDILTDTFGLLKLINSATPSAKTWTELKDLTPALEGKQVWIRARLQAIRGKGKIVFWVLRQQMFTVQAVCSVNEQISKDMVKWCQASVTNESIVDVFGTVTCPKDPVTSTTQSLVELHMEKAFCVSKAAAQLPFQLEDANRGQEELDKDAALVRVGMDIRLDNRILDLRTLANQAIFRVQSMVGLLFREYLTNRGFIEIHSPKLIGGSSEGGSEVFQLKYFEQDACLAQSPQLYKQMVLAGDMDRVFEIGPVFRAENSNTARHLCEFMGLDVEMTMKEHYFEILDELDGMFRHIFEGLAKRCQVEVETVHKQYPAEKFQLSEKTPRIEFEEGCRMLREAGVDVPVDCSTYDIGTVEEKLLGNLVKQKYGTDFYMLIRYPLSVRPFYTMPDPVDQRWSNSYDFFMRGQEIVSGAQRIHEADMLVERAKAKGMKVETIQSYVDSFKLGAYPHGGCGVGLERVVMLFLGLQNVRLASLFPRDPKRLTP